jgi:hypothetical protein
MSYIRPDCAPYNGADCALVANMHVAIVCMAASATRGLGSFVQASIQSITSCGDTVIAKSLCVWLEYSTDSTVHYRVLGCCAFVFSSQHMHQCSAVCLVAVRCMCAGSIHMQQHRRRPELLQAQTHNGLAAYSQPSVQAACHGQQLWSYCSIIIPAMLKSGTAAAPAGGVGLYRLPFEMQHTCCAVLSAVHRLCFDCCQLA